MAHPRESSHPDSSADEQSAQAARRRPYQPPNLRVEALHAVVRANTSPGGRDAFGFFSALS
jgi:hypothetical protein